MGELEAIRARHQNRPQGSRDWRPWCTYCSQGWPCDVETLFAEVERLRGVVEAAREVVRIYDGPAHYPGIEALRAALEAR